MENKKQTSQEWIEIENIFDNGVIKLKKNKYVKILKITPINFNLKSDFEKESILNSYKIFLKTNNLNIQILIQSKKVDLKKSINCIEKNLDKENNENLLSIGKDYINFINSMNSPKTFSEKDFYIIISNKVSSENIIEDLVFEELNDNFIKIKESLSRCGNDVRNINNKNEVEQIIFSFFNSRLFFMK